MSLTLGLKLAGLFVLFVLCGFFAAAETALFSLTKLDRRRMQERHPHLARWVFYHLNHPRRTLASILIGNMVVSTLAASIATLTALETWSPHRLGLVLTLFTVLLILFGEIMPKIVAARKNETVSILIAVPLQIFAVIIYPLRRLTRLVTDGILTFLTHERIEHPDLISEQELKTLLKIGEEEGVLDQQERHMIQKLFELGERQARSIMTPRIDLAALNVEDPRPKQIETIRRFSFSHFPVYQNSMDHILGVVSVQEYMLSPERNMQELLKQPLFIPETKRIDDLLAQFRSENKNFAVCVDEYGGTAGIVTLEDILEEIFGEIYDEYSKVENPIRPFGQREFLVDAKINLPAFNEHFATHLQAAEATTLAGYILEKLGEVPQKGKLLKTPECEIRIHEVIRQRIRSVIVRPSS